MTYTLVIKLMHKYAKKFYVPIEQYSIQNDHIHLNVRPQKRALTQHFFRVFAGQLAQKLLGTVTDTPAGEPTKRLWKYRPFTRVIQGRKHERKVKDYIQLNEKEARGEMKYRKERLRNLSPEDYEILWA